jgi:hypothetical protein
VIGAPLASSADGADPPRRSRWSRLVLHAIGLVAAGLASWLVFRAYQRPGMLLELGSLMMLC